MNFDVPPSEPLNELLRWLDDAGQTSLPNPNAMTLATVDARGRPSARIVLLKDLDERGAVFYTNRLSRKGVELGQNPRAALLFHWDPLDRQVRIEGEVTAVSDADSDAYFASRPRESQLGAWASQQSKPAKDRAELLGALAAVQKRFTGTDVPRPPHWGGYRVTLSSVEFWQGDQFRMHDRLLYSSNGRGGWRVERLYP